MPKSGRFAMIETCGGFCLIILLTLLPMSVIVQIQANGALVSSNNLVPGGPIQSELLMGVSSSSSSASASSQVSMIPRSVYEHKRRVEYSKPGKSFTWDRRRWTKDYGSISRRSRRSLVRRSRVPPTKTTTPNPSNKLLNSQNLSKNHTSILPKNANKTVLAHQPKLQVVGKPNLKIKQPSREQLESVLNIPGVQCGKVPLYEKLYHRSINESYEIDPETGDFRILHGLDSVVGEWPWIVRITECLDVDRCAVCTGTLLNDRWIITAGHCAFNQTTHPERYNATFGLYDLVSPENTSFTMPIERLIVHQDYKELNNDLTLIKLPKPVPFSDMVAPACLIRPTRNVIEFSRGKRCYTVGYGLTGDGTEDAIKLQKLEIRAKQPNECNSYELGAVQLKPGTVCIGPPEGKSGSSCKGDSGGPNLCYDPKLGSWSIFATVSYGPSICDRENGDSWLTVSVDLSNYRTWILSTILANS